MTRSPILIRVDATPQTGYERLARCLTLAAALQRRRRPVHFLSRLEPASLAFAIKRGGNDWIEADNAVESEEDVTGTIQEIRRLNPAAALIDDGSASHEYLREIAGTGALLVSIDHQASVHFPSHLVVNPLLGPGREAYEFDAGAQLLLGRRFALVRPEIRRLRPARAQEPPPITQANGKTASGQYRVLLALGEDDPNRKMLELTRLLLTLPRVGKVDVVVRTHHPELESFRSLAEANAERLEIASEPAEVAARVVRCHFALTSGSGWSLELACVGVPQLLIVQNELHWPTAQRLEEEGAATCLGWHESVSTATIRTAVQNLLTDPLERQAMARCGRKLIDARGPDRFVTALEVLLHRPARLMDFSAEAA